MMMGNSINATIAVRHVTVQPHPVGPTFNESWTTPAYRPGHTAMA
jgi:hypothetical protein